MQTIELFHVDPPTGKNFFSEPAPLDVLLEELTNSSVCGGASNAASFVCHKDHPFVSAVHQAFATHVPLVLSPDDIWLCIISAFALHVKLNAETLRDRFVFHQGRESISLRRDDFILGAKDNDWPGVLAEYAEQLAMHVGEIANVIAADFSTTTAVERDVSQIVLMSAMQPYFAYELLTICGIPKITVLGTPADWKEIRRRASRFASYELENWIGALLPVLDQFVAAACGNADKDFWRSIFTLSGGCGAPKVSGWINTLFPYVRSGGIRRPTELKANSHAHGWETGAEWMGPSVAQYPWGLSRAPFEWNHQSATIPMEFLGGFVGVSRDRETLAMRPVIGWAVRKASGASPTAARLRL